MHEPPAPGPNFITFDQNYFGYLGSLCSQMNLRFFSVKKYHWDFDSDCIESIDPLGEV
jgi:hypothetical protein